ncbi:glycosyltransferase family 2 protein [Luteimonas suaedae]|uniref:glycosyltransferase family 2 protein n=1 Tax=Luteimonas suaedae TaxID=2605430 RepID=UPI0011EF5BDA|nr:glycosyltransferase family 2 protein [Luteimonas suaedae]
MRAERSTLPLSVVIPAYDEAGNLPALVLETAAVLRGRTAFEVLCVDDASNDGTVEALRALRGRVPELRLLRHARRCGQSTAIRNGVRAARGAWIATLDGDGQNDPADIPRLLEVRDAAHAVHPAVKMLAGWRVRRRDSGARRWASRWANRIRARLLHDDTPDTGCGLKLFERAAFLELPYFDHMHRYLPALMQRAGWQTRSVPVGHRPRTSGISKYDNLGRALAGLADLRGVTWLMRRSRLSQVEEL